MHLELRQCLIRVIEISSSSFCAFLILLKNPQMFLSLKSKFISDCTFFMLFIFPSYKLHIVLHQWLDKTI